MIVDEIKGRLKAAMKAGNVVEKEILRVALGEIQTVEARSGAAMTDEQAAAVLKKLVKSNQETLQSARNDEEKRQLTEELAVLETLLPKTLDESETIAALGPVTDSIQAAKNDGQATGIAMKHLKAQGSAVDGKVVAQAVKKMRA